MIYVVEFLNYYFFVLEKEKVFFQCFENSYLVSVFFLYFIKLSQLKVN